MLSKITIAASIAVASAMARRKVKKNPYDEDTAYYLGRCLVKDSAQTAIGAVKFHQELTGLEEE